GTAFNGVVEELKKLTVRVAHVLPVSDDGGSTAEIVRVLGGPAVGDIRSRCLRLADESTSEALAVRRLLGHRLPINPQQAKSEWYKILEGEHSLWEGVSKPYRETIRAFLAYFQNEFIERLVAPSGISMPKVFMHCEAFVIIKSGHGARIFFQSLDAAIFLFSRVSDIPAESLVLPVISTNDRLTLGCELWDGTIIRGQNEISHPTNVIGPVDKPVDLEAKACFITVCALDFVGWSGEGGLREGRSSVPALPSRIKRVFYMSSEGTNSLH
ncbi:hypothetical protein Gogos_004876, partial [Gossypium gossypioides]|nr:hypothetical protein [Gossypium gossypioides]